MKERLWTRREFLKYAGTSLATIGLTGWGPALINFLATRVEQAHQKEPSPQLIEPAPSSVLWGGYYAARTGSSYELFNAHAQTRTEFVEFMDDNWAFSELARYSAQGQKPALSLHSVNSGFLWNDRTMIHNILAYQLRPFRSLPTLDIRPWFEMNIPFFRYGTSTISPTEFIVGWRESVQVIRASVPQARIIWSAYGKPGFSAYFPGEEWVDAVGLDIYNMASSAWNPRMLSPNLSFLDIAAPLVKEMKTLTQKPMILSEVGIDAANSQAETWFSDMLFTAPRLGFTEVNIFVQNRTGENWGMEANWNGFTNDQWQKFYAQLVSDSVFKRESLV